MMLCLLFVLIDQIIKAYIVAEKPVKVIIPDIIKIVYSENTGTVFGLAPGSNSMLCIVAIVIIIALVIISRNNIWILMMKHLNQLII